MPHKIFDKWIDNGAFMTYNLYRNTPRKYAVISKETLAHNRIILCGDS
jgi:hypothetical protein